MNSHIISKTKDFINFVHKYIPEEVTSRALSIISDKNSALRFKIPILSSDDDVIEFINEYGLNKLENMIKFFIELYFENFELLNESITDLKDLDLINTIGKVSGAKRTYEMSKGVVDAERKFHQISSTQTILNEACSQLEEKALFYINKQRNIDTMSRFKKALRRKNVINEIDSNNNLTKQALRTLMAAVTLHTVIAKDTGDDIYLSVIKPYDEFKSKLLANDTCLLMNDYDVDYTDKFWLNLSETLNTVNMASIITIDMKGVE